MTVVISGANKGLGFQAARLLAKNNYPGKIVVTSRKQDLGQIATSKLKNEFRKSNFVYQPLDINCSKSRTNFIDFTKSELGEINVLINNAGVLIEPSKLSENPGSKASFSKIAAETLETNYFNTKAFTEEILPHVSDRVVTASGIVTSYVFKQLHKSVQENLQKCSSAELTSMAEEFLTLTKEDKHKEKYGYTAYGLSLVLKRTLTEILARDHPDKQFYSYCPGWCKTDMTGYNKPTKSAEEGADMIWWLATEEKENLVNGGFYFDNRKHKRRW